MSEGALYLSCGCKHTADMGDLDALHRAWTGEAMTTDPTIPPEALEAAAKADHAKWIDYASVGDDRSQYPTWDDLDAEQKAEAIDRARAACLAMLKAWPKVKKATNGSSICLEPHIILPLPTENTND